ncbi:MAG: 6-phosphogluconolactonase [Hyphomicrobiales bacterium]|nr:6-phosphogluconolactonase [Hyphomicrobiales bacterium]MCY4053474.1 6-phosphogluconolactonase [Hyphomicrobiales bacterium]
MNIIRYETPDAQAENLAKAVAQELDDAVGKRQKATLAVPGGTTPGLFLTRLSLEDIDWSKVTVTLTDERWVPETSERSNFALLRDKLGRNKAKEARFFPLYRDAPTPEEAYREVESALSPHLPIDVCVVGMGEDMHTASLFPRAEGLDEALSEDNPCSLAPIRLADSGEMRLTLTAFAFNQTALHHVLIKGENKIKALEQAEQTPSLGDAPIRLIFNQPRTTIHYTA